MKSKNLVICDREETYASAFAHFVMSREELAFRVQTCSDFSHVLAVQREDTIDYLFISEDCLPGEVGQIEAGKIFILTDKQMHTAREGETVIYKYQSGEQILSEFVRQCGIYAQGKDTFLRTVQKKTARIIGVYSPVHRTGKTAYALELGQKLAVERNTLYLNLETYGGIGGYFPEGTQTLSDLLYYAGQEKSNLGLVLTTIVQHRGKLDYVAPIQVSEDIKSVAGEEWKELLQRIMEESIYETLILDIGEGVRDIYSLLRDCHEIHVLTAKDRVAKSKVRQFEEELLLLGYEDIRRKLIFREKRA